ncbi:DUF2269 domain-containing protein [Streptomyces qinzhouensis]|uniref:DUF2269 domain-containing protein n=1 Tax=Streptomyces qinzhouensis TaxID=2599401 RepID=A0A5B8J924_9ACTN|nr:DUF2269 domain-containing protein [Streptomyces qinzhouensis]QDY77796.1 DUF2269 domain-containing protein [Streptomyces qinzhouensis]
MKPLSRPARRTLLVVHVSASASWLGLTLGLLALAVTAVTTDPPAGTADGGPGGIVEAAVRSMKVFTDWLVLPLALVTLGSGLLLALGTPWGLARHRWVLIKFWLTLITLTATALALRPGVDATVETVTSGAGPAPVDLMAGPIVSFCTYLFMTAVSVLKPWGPTRRGRRLRAEISSRKALDERSPRRTV